MVKMVGILITIFGAGFNAQTLVGNNSAFGKSGRGDAIAEHKRHNFINKGLREKNEARIYISNVVEAIVDYCRVFAK